MIAKWLLAGIVAATLLPESACAEPQQTLGWGHFADNDAMGDFHDRWHSGSYTVSVIRGQHWDGLLPTKFGEILEFRFSGGTITPANLEEPAKGDRRYVAPLSLGVHTHLNWQGFETSLGADLVFTGPQTGIGRFQSWLHNVLGVAEPDLSNQIGNAVYPTLQAELGRTFVVSDNITMRPFVSAQAGVETYVRAGGDLVIGSFGRGSLMLRDDVTGQRYRAVDGIHIPAMSFTLGGDVARVFGSAYLSSSGPTAASDTRTRIRAGVQWQGEKASVFYGITYLSPEFDSQPQGQIVGSLNVNLRF
ncbi:MAG: lipid A-modifier LpxR family protein [Paracoccaceae bacterium]